MGVRNYLIDGISGVGKTAVADELERRGFHVIHGDRVLGYFGDPITGEELQKPTDLSDAECAAWLNEQWIWTVDIVKYLVASQRHEATFFCGSSRNSRLFFDLFDKVFVLDVDLNTLKQRLAKRPENEFGGREVEQELIARLYETQNDIPKKAVKVAANGPVQNVADEILSMISR